MTCYISGPMRGYKDLNFPAFDKAKAILTAQGYEVISPADMDRLDPRLGHSEAEQLRIFASRDTHAIIANSDAIALLPGWAKSKGATAEFFLARWLRLAILDAETGRAYGLKSGYPDELAALSDFGQAQGYPCQKF